MKTEGIAEGLRICRGQRILYVKGVTFYPASYIEGKLETFNLRRFPKNATDKTVFAQLPTPSAIIKFG